MYRPVSGPPKKERYISWHTLLTLRGLTLARLMTILSEAIRCEMPAHIRSLFYRRAFSEGSRPFSTLDAAYTEIQASTVLLKGSDT